MIENRGWFQVSAAAGDLQFVMPPRIGEGWRG
jgi:hypothetical protein